MFVKCFYNFKDLLKFVNTMGLIEFLIEIVNT